jgi:para-nitrobenzyl esterase
MRLLENKMRRILIVSLVLLFAFCGQGPVSAGDSGPRVDTSSGLVEGVDKDDVQVFLGIPYAEPPVGERRFLQSEIKEREEGVFLAHDFGPACIQEHGWKVPAAGVSEDCLSLNLWTPALDGKKRPVMVWIHGGGYINGSGADPRFNGAAFARRGDVVLVTINYRLGFLGFLDFAELWGDEYNDSVNNGLKDQMLALAWVRQNAAAFSGDPGNVTVFGNSAGAGSVAGLIGTDHPERLFERAISQSRPKLIRHDDAKRVARIYQEEASAMGLGGPEDWRAMDEAGIFELMEKVKKRAGSTMAMESYHGPTFGDGLVLPMEPAERLKTGHASKLEIIIGTTMDEVHMYVDHDPTLCDRDPYDNELNQDNPLLGLGAVVLAKLIKMDLTGAAPQRKSFSDGQALLSIADEIFFRIPSFEMADAHAQGGGVTYTYLFEYPVNRPGNCLHESSPHALETPFVFHNLDAAPNQGRIGPARDEDDAKTRVELANTAQDAWIAFARSGDPNVPGSALGVWPVYKPDKRETLVIGPNPRVVKNPFGFERNVIKMAGADKVDLFEQ